MMAEKIYPPFEPYWTEKMVEAYLEEAAKVMRALPPVRVQGYFSTWPEPIHDYWIVYGRDDPARNRFRPTPFQIDRMEYVLTWLRWPSLLERRIIWDRANRIPWKVLEHRYQSSRTTLWRQYAHGLVWIVARLNMVDPAGDQIMSYRG